MEIAKKYLIISGVGIAFGGILAGYSAGRVSKDVEEPDLKPFKNIIRERFKHMADIALKGEKKAEAFERVREEIKKDIHAMYEKAYHLELLEYSDKMWTEFYNKSDAK